MEKRSLFTRVWAGLVSALTFGMSKRYGKELREDNQWGNRTDPHRTQNHKKRGSGYTKNRVSSRKKRYGSIKPYYTGMPRLKNKSWGMV